MSFQEINIGTAANDKTGDGLRTAMQKVKENFNVAVEKGGAGSVPSGGTTGQILAKVSNGDHELIWDDPPEGLPVGGTTGQTLVKASDNDGDFAWSTPGATDTAAAIHGADAKTTPVDADTTALIDSAASNDLKKVSWANIKATLKAYFDTLYYVVGGALGTPSSGTLTNCDGLPASALVASTSQAVGFGSINLGHATDTTITRSASGVIAVEGHDLAKTEPGVNAQTGTSYTLVLADKGRIVTMNNENSNTLTIPANGSVAFPLGTIINVLQIGAGVTTITGDTGVTLNGVSAGSGDIGNQYQGVSLLKIATDTWVASGDIGEVA